MNEILIIQKIIFKYSIKLNVYDQKNFKKNA